MSRFAKGFHLTCAIIAALTCIASFVLVGFLVFYCRTVSPPLDPSKPLFLLIPALVIGAGALMEFKFYNEERKGTAGHDAALLVTSASDKVSTEGLITTRARALAAIALTLWMLIQGLQSLLSMRLYSPIWLFSGLLPQWPNLLATVAFYGLSAWTAVTFARALPRKEEKTLMFTLFAVLLLAPIGVVLPKATTSLRVLQTLLELTALLASISILLSLQEVADEKPREDETL